MHSPAQRALLLLLWCPVAIPAARAQQSQQPSNSAYGATRETSTIRHNTTEPRQLTPDEGLAVLGAALDSRHHKAFSSDCSHFVHGLYQRAGFPYTYASSYDLYSGIEDFRRVTNPQPGDLAVWPGHAGIVVNPVQHSFFSLLRSGPGVDSYNSPYWRKRGRPHFFRYVKMDSNAAPSGSLRAASLRPTAMDNADPSDPDRDPTDNDPVSDKAADTSEKFSTSVDARASVRPAEKQPVNAAAHPPVVNSVHPKPEQLTAAFLQACADSGPSLGGRDLLMSPQPVIVFERFAVKKVHISGSQNWVDVQINELVSITGGKTDLRKHTERERWPLIHSSHGMWQLAPRQNTIYLSKTVISHILAQQLAQLTADGPGDNRPQQKSELAQLLNALLQEQK